MKNPSIFDSTDIQLAYELDAKDPLASYRGAFSIPDPDLIYLDGNSLGRLPRASVEHLHTVIEYQWGERLIRSWNEDWMAAPATLGAKIAQLVGAQVGEVLVSDATSINLFKLAVAALRARPGRKKIVSDIFNFPSDLYILQGAVDLLGGEHQLALIPSDDGVSIAARAIEETIDQQTALVSLSHVAFKSAYMYDMQFVNKLAQQAGALVLWDLSHAAGAVPVDLNANNADLAVGCTYKYLNGGPGAPAFLYVRHDLQDQLWQPIWGWFAAQAPFDFDSEFTPIKDIRRYAVGTPPVLSMKALEPALDLLSGAGIDNIRHKSIMGTEYMIFLADQWLAPLGFTLGSPRAAERRGSHISLRHPEGYRITRALIESPPPDVRVIPDFRAPDNIRLGFSPMYNTFTQIYRAMARLRAIVEGKLYKSYPAERLTVT